jgi:hypothetical protein
MTLTRFRSGMLGPALVLAWASGAGAQPVASSSLDQLKALLPAHSKVTVTDVQGHEFRGTLADASESGLSLRIAGATRRFDAADVSMVRVRKNDSLLNGALIGAAVNGGLSSLMFLDNECHDDPVCYQAVAVYTGIGAVVGLGIDALIHRTVVVYTSQRRGTQHVVTVSPMIARGRTGVRLMVSF